MNRTVRAANLADVPELAKLHVDTWRTTYSGLIPAEYLSGLSYNEFEAGWTKTLSSPDLGLVYSRWVAIDSSARLLGFIGGGKQRTRVSGYDSELYGIYVLKEFEGQGVARALTLKFVQWLVERGDRSMILWVFQKNEKARGYYESLGGILLPDTKVNPNFGSTPLVEVAYAWSDLPALQRKIG